MFFQKLGNIPKNFPDGNYKYFPVRARGSSVEKQQCMHDFEIGINCKMVRIEIINGRSLSYLTAYVETKYHLPIFISTF